MKKDQQSVEQLLSKLSLSVANEEHQNVLDTATKILAKSPSDDHAKRLQLTSLIKLDRYTEAYKACDEAAKQQLPVHYAYILYKLEKYDELSKLTTTKDRAVLHVLAQAAYKREHFGGSKGLYDMLSQDQSVDNGEQLDIEVNKSALIAQNGLNHVGSKIPDPSPDSYDQMFNIATAYIGVGDYEKALYWLREAKLACENAGMNEEDTQSEVMPILVQAAFVDQLKGNTSEAQSILDNVEECDKSLRQIVENNKLAMDAPSNPHTALEVVDKVGDAHELSKKQVKAQSRIVGYNRLILQNRAGRDISRLAKKFSEVHPYSQGAEVLALVSKVDMESAEKTKKLRNMWKSSGYSLPSAFALAHVYCQSKNYDAAADAVESAHKALVESQTTKQAYSPGLVSVLISLYKLQHRDSAVCKLLNEALTHWITDYNADTQLLQMAASVLAGSDDKEQVAKANEQFTQLYKQDSTNVVNIAGVLASGGSGDASSLPSVDSLISGIDAERLNEDGVHPLLKRKINVVDASSSNKKAKSRKSKLPKDYDPEKQPDPERWLPKRDRSTWKPKRKDKRNAKNATQGGISAADAAATESGIQSSSNSNTKSSSSNNKKKNKKKGKK